MELYPGAPITISEFSICLATTIKTHKLTDSAVSDILKLFSITCIKPHNCPPTLHKFRKFFKNVNVPINRHYYCKKCTRLIDNTENDINNDELLVEEEQVGYPHCCECVEKYEDSYFITISPVDQLKFFFHRPGFFSKLSHKFSYQNEEVEIYRDIYDGSIYKNLSTNGNILSDKQNVSFMWYTDGVRIFKSSKYGIWGFFLIILELSYEERFKIENMLLVGLWFGDKKPDPNLFLNPLREPIENLKSGVEFFINDINKKILIKGILITGTCDLPAKALFLNMNQYNGKFGCQVCKERGYNIGRLHLYPFNENLRLRNDLETIKHAELAYESNKPVCGVKGPSVLSKICHNYITSTAVDVMHCGFEGCAKRLIQLWFDPKFSNEKFSVAELVEVVDYRLCSIKQPSFIVRRSRPIKTHLLLWKGSELKDFVQNKSVVILDGILATDYMNHYKKFVLGIYILSQQGISDESIDVAEELLKDFVEDFSHLYGEKYMSCNIHSLRHLATTVRRCGPLFTTSCFPLESINGQLTQFVHGSNSPHLQILRNLHMYLKVYNLRYEWLKNDSEAFKYCESLLHSKKKLKLTKISDLIFINGKLKKLSSHETESILKNYNISGKNVVRFKKLYKNKILYTSEFDQKDQKSLSHFVKYECNNIFKIGSIEKFVRVTNCNCKTCFNCDGSHYALIKPISTVNPFTTITGKKTHSLFFIHECLQNENSVLVDVKFLKCVCYYIFNESTGLSYVIEPANTIEAE